MMEKEVQGLQRRLRSTRKEITSGLSMVLLFGVMSIVFGSRFWLFPMVFVGVVPVIQGISRVGGIKSRLRNFGVDPETDDSPRIPEPGSREDTSVQAKILRAAQNRSGVLTPAIAALETGLPIERVDTELQEMAGKGYVSMEVTDTGRIEYHFDEFKPR